MAKITRTGSAQWQGGGSDGKGELSTQSGTLSNTPYSFARRFGDEKGTNPEELIAVAHAGCFNMQLAFMLAGAGHPPASLRTEAKVTIESEGPGFKISGSALTLRAKVPGMDAIQFRKVAEDAKEACPVSKVLNTSITLDAALE